jgi:hypothetical protein
MSISPSAAFLNDTAQEFPSLEFTPAVTISPPQCQTLNQTLFWVFPISPRTTQTPAPRPLSQQLLPSIATVLATNSAQTATNNQKGAKHDNYQSVRVSNTYFDDYLIVSPADIIIGAVAGQGREWKYELGKEG